MIDVSVIVPTHNRCKLVRQAIESIQRQRGVSIELIVVNDGSTDGTEAWLDRIAATDARIKVVHHKQPRFISAARNAGIANAAGRWVAFCDDDDLWAPNKLATQLRALRSSGALWGCTGVVVVDERLEIIGHHHVTGGNVMAELLENNVIPTGSSVIAELGFLRETGGFDQALLGSEDWDMWIRLALRSPLAAVDLPLIAYRLGMQTLSMDVNRMRAGRAIIVERYVELAAAYGAKPDVAAHERYLAKQMLRAGARWRAASIFAALAFRHGRWREVLLMAPALVAPRVTDQMGRARAAAAVPSAWRRDAETWIEPIREASKMEPRRSYPRTEGEELHV